MKFKGILNRINESLLDNSGKVSHTKISSYIILISIIVSSITFLGVDIVNAFTIWFKGGTYEVPISHITIFGMILGHHLFLLGIKKSSENNKQISDKIKEIEDTTS